jgi:hypothetical protein
LITKQKLYRTRFSCDFADLQIRKFCRTVFERDIGHSVEHNVGQLRERMVNHSVSDRPVQHMVRHVGRNVGRISEQSLRRSFDRDFEQSFIRNVGQTLDRIVIDQR